MKLSGKDFPYYWKMIRWPFYFLVFWSLAGFVVSYISFNSYQTVFGNAGFVLGIAVFAILGYLAIADHKAKVREAAWAGMLCGIFIGLISGILGAVLMFTNTALFDLALAQVVASGLAEDMATGILKYGSLFGIITGPIMNGALGAGGAALAGFIARKIEKK